MDWLERMRVTVKVTDNGLHKSAPTLSVVTYIGHLTLGQSCCNLKNWSMIPYLSSIKKSLPRIVPYEVSSSIWYRPTPLAHGLIRPKLKYAAVVSLPNSKKDK
ncbi:hypothetical protein E2C01_013189 [Portunus trituberculatus]|uniref:Uncharacterized protein n=1 Tax=Portunus trituberculatus TaxID=210409 RepID=A0A5B7DG96_PORTR|nr:hypothetical protein [Portunus trituberculatus]